MRVMSTWGRRKWAILAKGSHFWPGECFSHSGDLLSAYLRGMECRIVVEDGQNAGFPHRWISGPQDKGAGERTFQY
jgi:hypothetical protein